MHLVRASAQAAGLLGLLLVASGCTTPSLDAARHNFYLGRPDRAEEELSRNELPDKDLALYLVERGMVRQALDDYEGSSEDLIAASDELDRVQRYSLSQGGASWVVNDTTHDFRGAPYERTLLHVFTAKNHLAQGHWNDAAVEARRIIYSLAPETKGEYPDSAYARYMAGFCLALMDDHANAAVQYRKVNELVDHLAVDPATGRITPVSTGAVTNVSAPNPIWPAHDGGSSELVCFVTMGRSQGGYGAWPTDQWKPGYAEIRHNGTLLGRSYPLTDTMDLASTTEQLEAARKTFKTVSRIAIKEIIADSVESETSDVLGELVRLVLIGLLEQPDVRRWETLPRSLQVVRVPCPEGLTEFDVVFKNAAGYTTDTLRVEAPLQRHRNTYVSFCRDLRRKLPASSFGESVGAD